MSQEKPNALVVTGEDVQVDVRHVDSIDGAKPEPEERPAHLVQVVDPTSGEHGQKDGAVGVLPARLTVRQETTVNDMARFLGKTCGRCKHFDNALGQDEIARIAYMGTDEERENLDQLYNELILRRTDHGPEHLSAGEIFAPTGAETDMARVGTCVELTHQLSENVFVMPECYCPAPEIPEIQRDCWKPVDAATERSVNRLRDSLLNTAAGKE